MSRKIVIVILILVVLLPGGLVIYKLNRVSEEEKHPSKLSLQANQAKTAQITAAVDAQEASLASLKFDSYADYQQLNKAVHQELPK